MDADTFDRITRRLSASGTRRGALKALAGAAVGAALGRFGRADVAAQDGAADDPAVTAAKKRKRKGHKKSRPNRPNRPNRQNPPPPPPPLPASPPPAQPPPAQPPSNLALGAACTGAGQCSQAGGAVTCRDNNPVSDGLLNCCREGGGVCTETGHCCGFNVCGDNGVPEDGPLNCCGLQGSPCTNSFGCCGTTTCKGSRCVGSGDL